MKNVKITIDSNADAQQVFQTIQQLGVLDASLNGNEVTGRAQENLISPLRTVPGVSAAVAENEEGQPVSTTPAAPAPNAPNPSVPRTTPLPQPAPSVVPQPQA